MKRFFIKLITANENGTPYYTNSSHLPVGYTEDIFTALEIQDELQTRYTSGTVFHAFLGEKLPDWKAAADLVRKIAENHKLPYYTMSPTYSICVDHGYLIGEQHKCPLCGKKTEVYSRITGYYRPVQNWNDGKSQEFKDRKVYDIAGSMQTRFAERIGTEEATPECKSEGKLVLFTTATCPKCVMAKKFLEDAGLAYETVVVNDNPDAARKYGVKQAPTLLVLDGETVLQKVENPSNIRAFTEK